MEEVQKDFIETTYNQMRIQAERDVRGAMLLEKIAEIENVVVDKDAVKKEIGKMAAQYETSEEEIRKSLEQQGGEAMIENNLRTREAIEKLVEKAKIIDGDWIDENLRPAVSEKTESKDEEHQKHGKDSADKKK